MAGRVRLIGVAVFAAFAAIGLGAQEHPIPVSRGKAPVAVPR